MARVTSTGRCVFCDATIGKSAMTRHLGACKQRPADPPVSPGSRQRASRVFHLVATARHAPPFWMHLEASSEAALDDLDALLRRTWLECCGHLSAFRLGDRSFSANPTGDVWGTKDEPTSIKLGKLLTPGQTLGYEYDFGSTTELVIRVLAERPGRVAAERPGRAAQPIAILARNDPPAVACVSCERPATLLCSQCNFEADAWLCDACGSTHACGEEMLLPVVNSPRMGVCGYSG